jgi:hypothetical protein
VAILEGVGLLGVAYVERDRTTGRMAKHYTADPSLWQKNTKKQQLDLFELWQI